MDFTNFNTNQGLRDRFQEEGELPSRIHPALADSWTRSRDYGINPYLDSAPFVTSDPGDQREEILLEVAKSCFSYFGKLLVISDCALALSNSAGVIIHLEGLSNQTIKRLTDKHNFLVGGNWHEKAAGTNAIGMAISERNNILLQGGEHYSYGFHPYSCAAAPMFDRSSGEIIGVVDASTFTGYLNLHSLGWVAATARLIEAEFNKRLVGQRPCQTPTGKVSRHYLQSGPPGRDLDGVIGNSPVFLQARETARKVAKTGLSVLLTGETGTGKEIFARLIHQHSSRCRGPFVAVNCGALPGELVYSELFGYTEGAFTGASCRGLPGRFEQAGGGTILLDEIGDAPHEVQVGLLRVLEEKVVHRLGSARPVPVDVRVLGATSKDLAALAGEGRFREDLYFRLAGIKIKIPPLRERREDIPLLARHFLAEAGAGTGRCPDIDQAALQALIEYPWPGNVREIKNLMERLAALVEDPLINLAALERWGPLSPGPKAPQAEKDRLLGAVREAGGNISRAASLMGINRTTVYRRMKKYGLKI